MPNYKKVQFIAWEIYTGPMHLVEKPSFLKSLLFNATYSLGEANDYAGIRKDSADHRIDIERQCVDIDARVAFTKEAVETAFKDADNNPDVLKVFMAPEFLYRGAGGAYLYDLISGWKSPPVPDLPDPYCKPWPGLFESLKNTVADSKYNDWIFIFGTTIGAAFQTKNVKGAPIDFLKKAEIYNTAIVQCGGINNGHSYTPRKHLISNIDFINHRLANSLHCFGNVESLDSPYFIPKDMLGELESDIVFKFDHINNGQNQPIIFGLEVCLDHSQTAVGVYQGRLKTSQQLVDIQLVPSCGMRLLPKSISLASVFKAYAFNCDGLTTLNKPMAMGSHAQICNEIADNKYIFRNYSNDFNGHYNSDDPVAPKISKVPNEITLDSYKHLKVSDKQLWYCRYWPHPSEGDFGHNPSINIGGSGYILTTAGLDLPS